MRCQKYQILSILCLWATLLFISCGNDGDVVDAPHLSDVDPTQDPRNAVDLKHSENSGDAKPFRGYYPIISEIEISSGKGYVDVTVNGWVATPDDFIADIQVIVLRREIFLVPIARPSLGLTEDRVSPFQEDRVSPFQKVVRIKGLEKGTYTLSVVRSGTYAGADSLITETSIVR